MDEKRKLSILFIPSFSRSVKNRVRILTGSYRIWIEDLSKYFLDLGINCKIGYIEDIPNFDVIIFGKHVSGEFSKEMSLAFKLGKKTGFINPPGYHSYRSDFIIAGSLEEKDSLSSNKNVFIYPLIEKMFEGKELKKHEHKDKLRLCFHGHFPHLVKFDPNLTWAINEFSKEQDVELVIIHGNPEYNWTVGRPDVKIIFKTWQINKVYDVIASCDIGLCPNAIMLPQKPLRSNKDLGFHDTDFLIRFKNKSNAGRSFVFHQIGLPVIADITPSNFHIMGDPNCGHIVMSKKGYLKALRELACKDHRNFIATNAKKEFNRLYNPLDWAKKLYNQILKL